MTTKKDKAQGIITLTKAEVEALKDYCDHNLAAGNVIVFTQGSFTKCKSKTCQKHYRI